MGDGGGAPDWYGYCLADPVNGVDPNGLESKKKALGRIALSTATGAGRGAWLGGRFGGWPFALAGGFVGASVGALKGTAKEHPKVRKAIDETEERLKYEITDGKAERMYNTRWGNYKREDYINK